MSITRPGRPRRLCGALLLSGCIACVTGCSDLTAKLSGTVFVDGDPLSLAEAQRGMIVFRPVAGGATCTGLVGDKGGYSVATGKASALVPGDYLVSVRVVELVESGVEGEAPSGKPLTPAVYADPLTSGLSVTVGRGSNVYDIELDSSAGPLVKPEPTPQEPEEAEGLGDAPAEPVETEEGSGSSLTQETETSNE